MSHLIYSQLNEDIENLIDKHGMESILQSICDISSEKASHLLENWQDKKTAAVWDKFRSRLNSFKNKTNLPS